MTWVKRAVWLTVLISVACISWTQGRAQGWSEERSSWAAAAVAAGHAERGADNEGRPAWSWLPPCISHWSVVRAKAVVSDQGLLLGEPEEFTPIRTARLGGRTVKVVGP